jgi:hypothetical protein
MHARRFEQVEALDCEATILRTAGENDRSCAHALAVGQSQHDAAVAVLRLEARHLRRNRRLDPEFLRLGIGAGHQRHAADAGREAEIVLDPRRRAGLAAERAAIEHDRREAFGRRVDRRGKTGRPGADDRDVIEVIGIDRSDHADAAGKLELARISQ